MTVESVFNLLLQGVIGYFLISNAFFFLLLAVSFLSIRKSTRLQPLLDSIRERSSFFAPRISVIAPARNEERSIENAVRSFLTLDYPKFEVIVVNDGSLDDTMKTLKVAFELTPATLFYDARLSPSQIRGVFVSKIYSNLLVIDKERGGKADSINVGIGFSRSELFCTVDADSVLERDSLQRVVLPFLEKPDTMLAVGGTVRPVNGSDVRQGRVIRSGLPKNPWALFQIVEYLRAFLFGRVGWSVFSSTMIISGAFGLFHRKSVVEAGGYRRDSVGEDMELILRLRAYAASRNLPVDIAFSPEPVCWTEVPENARGLGRQRERWQRGLAETLMSYPQMFLSPKYGFAGFVAYPYFLFVELLGPLVEVLGYLLALVGGLTGWISLETILLFFIIDVLFGAVMSTFAVLIEENAFFKYPRLSQLSLLMLTALLESLGYRQFCSFHRVRGLVNYLRGDRSWSMQRRIGFQSEASKG